MRTVGRKTLDRKLTKWGSVDLHVPKKMALYNGDGARFLKDSLTKTNKLAKNVLVKKYFALPLGLKHGYKVGIRIRNGR